MKIIILAGGGGTRLYPLSTPEKPKQFLALLDEYPLLIHTIRRFEKLCDRKDIVIVTGEKYRALTEECLKQYGYKTINVVYEPCAKNTAPAIALGVSYCKDVLGCSNQEAIFVAPSDHAISPDAQYLSFVQRVLQHVETGNITVLGILPATPNTEYGYMKAETGNNEIRHVEEFKEKPDAKTAEQYFKAGNYFWNAGMFGFTITTFENELKQNVEKLYELYVSGYRFFYQNFESAEKISIDYAIAEKSKNISMIPINIKWSDIGSFKAYYEFCDKDADGNVFFGNVVAKNCKNCFIYTDSGQLKIEDQKNKIVVNANNNMILINM